MKSFNKIMAAMLLATVALGVNAANDVKPQGVTFDKVAFYAAEEKVQLEMAAKLLSDVKQASQFSYGLELQKVTDIEAFEFTSATTTWALEDVTAEIIVKVLKAHQPGFKAMVGNITAAGWNGLKTIIDPRTYIYGALDGTKSGAKWCWDNPWKTAGILGGTVAVIGGAEIGLQKLGNTSLKTQVEKVVNSNVVQNTVKSVKDNAGDIKDKTVKFCKENRPVTKQEFDGAFGQLKKELDNKKNKFFGYKK